MRDEATVEGEYFCTALCRCSYFGYFPPRGFQPKGSMIHDQRMKAMSQIPAGDSQEQWRKIVSEDDATVLSHWRNLVRRFRKMPRWARVGALALLLIAALVVVY